MGIVLLPGTEPMDDVAAALDRPVERYAGPLEALEVLRGGTVSCVVVDGEHTTELGSLVGQCRRAGDVPVGVAVDPASPGAGVGTGADAVLDRSNPEHVARWVAEAIETHALERGERVTTAATRLIRAAERALQESGTEPGSGPGTASADDGSEPSPDSREEIERALVGTLGGTEPYPVAWVVRHRPEAGELQPVAAAGVPVAHLGSVRVPSATREESDDGGRGPAEEGSPAGTPPDGILAGRIVTEDTAPVAAEPAGEQWAPAERDRTLVGVRLPATPVGVLYLVADRPAGVSAAERRALRRLSGRVGEAIDAASIGEDGSVEDRRLRLLADSLAHELNNHVGAASIQLDLAAERGDAEHFEHVARALDRLEDLGAETRALAREEPDLEPVDLAEAATAAWEQLSTPGATLEAESATIEASPPLLRLALINLLRNAVEHGSTTDPEAGDDEGLTVRVGPEGEGFYVADDGPGIPPADRETVFEWGHSGGGGDGVGLGVIALVAERHGWSARAEESERGGARVVLAPAD